MVHSKLPGLNADKIIVNCTVEYISNLMTSEVYFVKIKFILGHFERDEGPGFEPRRAGGHRYDKWGGKQWSRLLPRLLQVFFIK